MSHGRFFALLLTGLLFFSCGPLHRKQPASTDGLPDPRDMSVSLAAINSTLDTFKGIGKIQIEREGKSYNARIAWIGSVAGKLRVEVMGAPGSPKIGFSSDEKWIHYYDTGDAVKPIKRVSANNPNLKRMISIPVSTREVASVLAGRLPEYEYHSLQVKRRKTEPGFVLIREKKWRMGSQKIYVDPSLENIDKIEVLSGNRPTYNVEFLRMRSTGGYRVPSELSISNGKGSRFHLEIDRYLPNTQLAAEMFELNPPGFQNQKSGISPK